MKEAITRLYDDFFRDYITSMKNNYSSKCFRKIQNEVLFEIIKLIRSKKADDIRILSLGCGPCIDELELTEKFRMVKITGVDLSKRFISYCSRKLPDHEFFVSDIFSFLRKRAAKGKYDLIMANFGVINHFSSEELELFFRLAKRSLSDEYGFLFISFLNKYALNEMIYFTLKLDFKNVKRRFKTYHKGFGERKVNIFFYSTKKVKNLLKKCEFEILFLKGAGLIIPPPFSSLSKHKLIVKVLCNIEKAVGVNRCFSFLSDLTIVVSKG